jgi:hypothetical protein
MRNQGKLAFPELLFLVANICITKCGYCETFKILYFCSSSADTIVQVADIPGLRSCRTDQHGNVTQPNNS